jgi:hypothetical protein
VRWLFPSFEFKADHQQQSRMVEKWFELVEEEPKALTWNER